MKKLLLFILCVWSVCLKVSPHDYMFKHLEVKDGLSNNQVNAIYKDSHGFMWFGTASGLNRYDGYDIRVYRSQKDDETSLPDNYIEDIQEDASGNLWLRTGAGYAIYRSDSDTFDRNMKNWMENIGIDGELSAVYIDQEKSFWVKVPGKGIYCLEEGKKSAVLVKGTGALLANADVSDMAECGEGLLLAFYDGTLACLDKEKLGVKWVTEDIARHWEREKEEVFTLFVDHDERIWMYGVEGMWVYHLSRKAWETCSGGNGNYSSIVRAVSQDNYGNIWIGRDQDGIEVVRKNGKILRLMNDPNDDRTLSNNTVTALYTDAAGTVWAGTYKKGVSYYNESSFKFGFANVGDINCVEDGPGNIVWLGTNDGGLIRWNMLTDERKVFLHTADSRSISSNVIVCLLRDSKERLWAGTFWGGLNCYDGNRFVHYRAGEAGTHSLACDNVWALAEDAEGNIWIGTLGKGLQCLNPETGTFTTYTTGNSDLVSDYVFSLCIGRDHMLYVGTTAGLAVIDLNMRTITNVTGTKSGKAFFSHLIINQVYEDSRGLLWLATREGLNVYDLKRDELYEVPIKRDFSKLPILGITEGDNKDMWVSTGGELINVVLQVDSKTEHPVFRCYAYNDKDGLQSCDFNQRSLKRLHTGEIVLGGLYGLNRFYPDNIKYNRTLPKVMFTGFQLFNEDVKVGGEYAGRVLLKKALNETEEIVLDYKQNVFTVFFASDNYVLPEKTGYFYKLEGFNDDWLASTADMHRVTYTNLAPGTYTLRVKAVNSDGYKGTDEARLKIVILPPFWMTPWAYVLYVLLLAGILLFVFYSVQRRERNKFKIRQMEEDAKKKEELNQMKFRFFTNVSHELRTPLTLIISPLEGMMKEMTDEKLQNKLQLMHRNAVRLLNLVNQLLDFRKNEMSGMHLSLSEGDIVAFIRNICTSFLMLSEKKHVHLTFYAGMESLNMLFDEDKIGKTVMNLLSNAFKFTPEGGRVDVALEMQQEKPDRLSIKVSDTGIGIKDEDKERIFERFYQVEQEASDHHQSTGSGIGLSLVRDFVMLHGGSVRVVDNVGSGSVFLIELPVKRCKREELLSGREEEIPLEELPDEEEGEEEDGSEREKPLAVIVDDNADLIEFMKESLNLYFRVQSASNGREAWSMIPELMPDIIVSDVMMPEMDGNELCHLVKTDKRTSVIPVILLTAKQAVEDKVEGLTIGVDDYMTKPFMVEILILRMRKLIELSGRNRTDKIKTRIDPEPSEIAITSMDEKLVENAIKYVEENIARCDLSVKELSHELGMSRVHLYKKLLQITGKTPIEFIRVIRLKRAAQLLRESQRNVSEIAYQCGFNNPKYFSKYFKDEFGVLPSVYQEKEGK